MLYGFLAVLALGVLIIVHEWGHYIVAKLCNMRVDRFAIGFGPQDYFALMCLAFITVSATFGDSPLRGWGEFG